MKLRNVLIALLLLFLSQPMWGQLDRYKYFVVPKQFDGFKNENQFRTSTLIKYLFEQNGFPAIYDDNIPPDLAAKPCQGARVVLIDNSSLLLTKVKLGLQDCYGQVIFETLEGKSKLKDFELAYRESIQDAFVVIAALGYSYRPDEKEAEEATGPPVVIVAEEERENKTEEATQAGEASGEVVAVAVVPEVITETEAEEVWYAQPVDNGYQLVDSTPTIRMKLVNTSQEDTFIAMVDGAPMGMVYKKNGNWWHEFYQDGKATLRKLEIKF